MAGQSRKIFLALVLVLVCLTFAKCHLQVHTDGQQVDQDQQMDQERNHNEQNGPPNQPAHQESNTIQQQQQQQQHQLQQHDQHQSLHNSNNQQPQQQSTSQHMQMSPVGQQVTAALISPETTQSSVINEQRQQSAQQVQQQQQQPQRQPQQQQQQSPKQQPAPIRSGQFINQKPAMQAGKQSIMQMLMNQQQQQQQNMPVEPATLSPRSMMVPFQQQQSSMVSYQPQQQVMSMEQSPVQQQRPPISVPVQQQQQQQSPPPPPPQQSREMQSAFGGYRTNQHQPNYPLYFGHNPYIEILKPHSYADDNIVTLNLSHSHIYEIDSDAFVGQRFEHIDLSNNKLGLIHSRSFRIGPNHSKHNPYNPNGNNTNKLANGAAYPTRRPPPAHPKSVTIDFSHNPAIVALSGAFDHIDVPNCMLNFTNSTVELKFGAFKKYFKEHPGHMIDIESVDCCEQEWLLSYKHNFVMKTHCDHDPGLLLSKVPQQAIIDSCIAYVTRARQIMTIQGPSIIHQVAAAPRSHSNSHVDNQYLTYVILGGTAMILTSLSIYIIFYMFSLKAAFVYQMQQPPSSNQHKS